MPADLRKVRTFNQLVRYLEEELGWPLEGYDVEELTYDYEPDEIGLKPQEAAKVKVIRQLRPLAPDQPWGIFFIEFDRKKLPVAVLRRILSHLVLKKRATAGRAERAAWQADDLLFISAFGIEEDEGRELGVAHFHQDAGDLPTLRVLGWDGADTKLKIEHVSHLLHERLHWRGNNESVEQWRQRWTGAFRHKLGHVIKTADRLAEVLAALAKAIRDAAATLMEHETEKGPLTKLYRAFQSNLIHDLTPEGFADTYAQTITYGLLTAAISRTEMSEGAHGTSIVAANVTDMVPVTNPFLREMLETFLKAGGRKGGIDFDELGVQDVVDLLRGEETDLPAILRDFGNKTQGEDPVIHFYEHFLKAYNRSLKVDRGVFYTPQPVVAYIVGSVHELLKTRFGLPDGLADTATWSQVVKNVPGLKIPRGAKPEDHFVQILDIATGTGTFLVEIIDLVHRTLVSRWKESGIPETKQSILWNDYVITHLLPRLHGYELLMAPYAIAHMKIPLKLKETGFTAWDKLGPRDRVRVYLTDSLEPHQNFSDRLAFDVPALAEEARAVSSVKKKNVFTVVVGNPPYLREKERGPGERSERIGGWVRFGEPSATTAPLFDDFIKPLSEMGRGVHAKLAYELSVIFWRLALFTVFERGAGCGVIGMISPRAYISGPGHAGMRMWLKRHASEFWIADLGGDNRGARKSENIFDIETGVAIGICSKALTVKDRSPDIKYHAITGTSEEKLAGLRNAHSAAFFSWQTCPTEAEVFLPSVGSNYQAWPKLTDLFPWQHSGCQFKRLWPIAESKEILVERWRYLLALPPKKRGAAFIETDARLVGAPPSGRPTLRYTGIELLAKAAPLPNTLRYTYRAFDRQWAFVDDRFADRLRPTLVATLGPSQVYAATLMSKQLGEGPAVTVTNHLPDMDIFCNRGAKDIIPLWRDASCRHPNLPSALLNVLSKEIGYGITAPTLFCYCISLLSGPRYASMFEEELTVPGPRIPITRNKLLFERAALMGAEFVWFQTYGERWMSERPNPNRSFGGAARFVKPTPRHESRYPTEFAYDAVSGQLSVGEGLVAGVPPEVFNYRQSGFKPVESWLRYRMKERGGRAGRATTRSDLDMIRPRRWSFDDELLELLWSVEGCVRLWPKLSELLDEVVSGEQILASSLPLPTDAERSEPLNTDDGAQLKLL
jgi:hypothetical protein